jgi:hypothetical protein
MEVTWPRRTVTYGSFCTHSLGQLIQGPGLVPFQSTHYAASGGQQLSYRIRPLLLLLLRRSKVVALQQHGAREQPPQQRR